MLKHKKSRENILTQKEAPSNSYQQSACALYLKLI